MKIQRTVPPTAAPIPFTNLLMAISSLFFEQGFRERLEAEVKEYFDVEHVFLVSSGKAALFLILQALKSLSPQKKEVLIPAYTCFSVPSAITKTGLKISLFDVDDSSFGFNDSVVLESINDGTLCVIPTHILGIPSNIEELKRQCKERGVFIIEDVAQAMGVRYKGKLLGTMGDVGFFSLGRGKNITCGSGGIIVTNSDQIARMILEYFSQLKTPAFKENIIGFFKMVVLSLFIHPALYWFPSGLPFLKIGETLFHDDFPVKKLSGTKASLLRGWKKRLERSNRIRAKNAEYIGEKLGFKKESEPPLPYLRLPFMVKNKKIRENIYAYSSKKGLGVSHMYPTPINEIKEICSQFKNKKFPAAKIISESLLTIPTHQLLSRRDKDAICHIFEGIPGLEVGGLAQQDKKIPQECP